MALLSATLSTELQAIVPTTAPPPAGALALAGAYGDYMAGATALTPIIPAAIPAAVTAMAGAMAFVVPSTAAAGAAAIAAGVSAFWATMVAAPVTFFAASFLITPPPGLAGLASALSPVLTANAAPGVTLVQASDAIAAVIHTASLGGSSTTPVAVVTPIV